MKEHTVVVIPDLHYPLHDEGAVECVRQIIKKVGPDELIHLGDIGEWNSVSEWQWKRKKRPPLEQVEQLLVEEINGVNSFLQTFPRVKKTTILEGNHDLWLDYFYETYPYRGFKSYQFKGAINVDGNSWNYCPYGELYKVGKLYFYHGGHFTTMYHCRKHVMELGINIMYGHGHDVQRASVAQAGGHKAGFSIGCLKKLGASSNTWLKGRNHNWGNAVAVVDFTKSGTFRADVIDITDGTTVFYGKVIDGNKKR